MSVEMIFSSKTRIRILRELVRVREINLTRLSKMLGVNYKVISYHIDALKSLGIVDEKRFGRIRIVRLREEDPRVALIDRLFKELDLARGGDEEPTVHTGEQDEVRGEGTGGRMRLYKLHTRLYS
jgi:DNA-binding transcriptional ArsR family regulator